MSVDGVLSANVPLPLIVRTLLFSLQSEWAVIHAARKLLVRSRFDYFNLCIFAFVRAISFSFVAKPNNN